jgi:hypothetical protein
MRAVTIIIAIWVLYLIFPSCKHKGKSQKYTLRNLDFKAVIPDSTYLFKDTSFRPDDYFKSRSDYGYDISLIRLITTPEVYHSKRVHVTGFLHLATEESTLYLSQEDSKHGIGKNGVFVDFGDIDYRKLIDNFNDKYVTINGVFDMYTTGHIGFNSGSIKDVSRVYLNKW